MLAQPTTANAQVGGPAVLLVTGGVGRDSARRTEAVEMPEEPSAAHTLSTAPLTGGLGASEQPEDSTAERLRRQVRGHQSLPTVGPEESRAV
ncbi:MAG: hypothetical protein JWO98_2908 [Frankiales bacterium]|nr:hypothetical protein [Frankiales bacterium]